MRGESDVDFTSAGPRDRSRLEADPDCPSGTRDKPRASSTNNIVPNRLQFPRPPKTQLPFQLPLRNGRRPWGAPMDAIDARLAPTPAGQLAPLPQGGPEEQQATGQSPPTGNRIAPGDEAVISAEGLAALARSLQPNGGADSAGEPATRGAEAGTERANEQASTGQPQGPGATTLTPEEREVVRELSARDREVRAHEQAHKAAAGDLATGGPTYSYQRGPDGVNYAVGGEVGISLSEGRTPEETVRRAQRIQRAAMAPAEPSGQDRAVAAQAAQMAAQARAEVQAQNQAELEDSSTTSSPATSSPSTAARDAAIEAYEAVAGETEQADETEPEVGALLRDLTG